MMNLNKQTDYLFKLGLGCVTFGREIDKTASCILMDYAYDKGIDHFDTAAAYGDGYSEEIVGGWMKGRRISADRLTIATKILPPYTPEALRLSVERSLKRLQTDTLSVLYLHRWDDVLQTPEAWLVLDALRKEGKIGQLGVSNFNSLQLASALKVQHLAGVYALSFIQNNHNLAVSDISDELKSICLENGVKIVTFSPLGAGFLTGKHARGVEQDSRFSVVPAHQDIYFNDKSQRRLQTLLQVAERTGNSPIRLALSWAIHQAGITKVLIGGRTVAHLDQAFEAAKFYDREVFSELES